MQSGSDTDTSGTSNGPPTRSPIASVLPGSPAYSISVDDAEILLEHLEEFENARKRDRAKIIERAMGEICQRYINVGSFDKRDAKKVWQISLIFTTYHVLIRQYRRSLHGFIANTMALSVSTSSSLANGPPEVLLFKCFAMRSLPLQRGHLGSGRVHQVFWENSRRPQPLCSMH
jgi:hypothetical protein